jgi:hypothetical protein
MKEQIKKRDRNKNTTNTTKIMGYGLDDWDLNPGRGRIFLLSTISRSGLRPTQLAIQWVQVEISPGFKRLGHETDHSPPFSAKVKNREAKPPIPHIFKA